MKTNPSSTVMASFAEVEAAQEAIAELQSSGFPEDRIKLVLPQTDAEPRPIGKTPGDRPIRGAGAGVGALTGAFLGGIATGALPAMIVLGLAGGLVGALADLGVSDTDTQFLENELNLERMVVVVQADERADEVARLLYRRGAHEVRPELPENVTVDEESL